MVVLMVVHVVEHVVEHVVVHVVVHALAPEPGWQVKEELYSSWQATAP